MCEPDRGVLQVLCGVSGTIWGGCHSPCVGLSPWAPPGLSLPILTHLQPPSALPMPLPAQVCACAVMECHEDIRGDAGMVLLLWWVTQSLDLPVGMVRVRRKPSLVCWE